MPGADSGDLSCHGMLVQCECVRYLDTWQALEGKDVLTDERPDPRSPACNSLIRHSVEAIQRRVQSPGRPVQFERERTARCRHICIAPSKADSGNQQSYPVWPSANDRHFAGRKRPETQAHGSCEAVAVAEEIAWHETTIEGATAPWLARVKGPALSISMLRYSRKYSTILLLPLSISSLRSPLYCMRGLT